MDHWQRYASAAQGAFESVNMTDECVSYSCLLIVVVFVFGGCLFALAPTPTHTVKDLHTHQRFSG